MKPLASTGIRHEPISTIERFASKFEVTPEGCWEWKGSLWRGYGAFAIRGESRRAHRVAYELAGGVLDPEKQLDHLCRNRACVNPSHLEQVTGRENTNRGELGLKRRSMTHCKHGHEYTESSIYWAPSKTSYTGLVRVCRKCRKANEARRIAKKRLARELLKNNGGEE